MKKLGISDNNVLANVKVKGKGKDTTDTPFLTKVRKLMNNTFIAHTDLVNNATYFHPQYKRDENKRILLDKNNEKAIEGYRTKTLSGQYVVEDNGDGTSTATKFNVYKDTYLIDSNSINVTKVTNGNGK